MRHAPDLETIQGHFRAFAASYPNLALYHRFAQGCATDAEIAGMLAVARPGQERPVLLFAAVHDWVTQHPESELAGWYSSVTPKDDLATGDPWPAFRRTCLAQRDVLEAVIATHATQTNEVNRCVPLAALLAAACADELERPVTLLELGASAGLLLGIDRYRINIGDVVIGDADSPVRLAGALYGSVRSNFSTFPVIAERIGIDLDPIRLDDLDAIRWLEACLWPDQAWRIDRFRAAVTLLRDDPPLLIEGDFVQRLDDAAARLCDDTHLIVYSAWALTYVPRAQRQVLATQIAKLAGARRALSWAAMEPPGGVPGIEPPPWIDASDRSAAEATTPDTVLGLRRWRDGHELEATVLGWSHPHGNWLQTNT